MTKQVEFPRGVEFVEFMRGEFPRGVELLIRGVEGVKFPMLGSFI